MKNKIEILKGDITTQKVDAIVNAANNSLLGGGGVDGAIHRAAGIELLNECKTLNGCETGEAKMTKGYNLHSAYVIHTVGPVWRGGNFNESKLLASCYKSCLRIAAENKFKTIAFPSISTGAYGFPIEKASGIALKEIIRFLEDSSSIEKVKIVCFDDYSLSVYKQKFNDLLIE